MILILDCGSSKVPYIQEIIDDFCDFRTVALLDFQESDLHGMWGVIISGAPLLITEQDVSPHLQKLSWLKSREIPVLGICFGHQMMGLTFGAFGSRMREDREMQTIEAFENSPIFEKLPHEFEMMEDHCETISIPPGFKLIASSDNCVNEAMQHSELPLFGVQFHPESSGNLGKVIFENFYQIAANWFKTKHEK
jgi:GMP synthase (glutamine-hydrolysing)